MTSDNPVEAPVVSTRSKPMTIAYITIGLLLFYFVVAYLIVPLVWIRYAHKHPAFDEVPGITYTGDDHPGDPLNLALVGDETQLKKIMLDAKWYPADPLTLKSCLEIAAGTVFSKSYDQAPVSNLLLFGRKQDLAFEMPVGDNPRERHHVRFWKANKVDDSGRPLWVGSATFDKKVGLSHTTGEITHHIAGDVDTERDHLMGNLQATGELAEQYYINGFHKILTGNNGGGDAWHTDGRLSCGVIRKN